jgi:zinc transport system substrate-binding protein
MRRKFVRMRKIAVMFAGLMLLLSIPGRPVYAAEPAVAVASIGPLHALLAQVMHGVSNPAVLLPPGVSPHHYALRPSDIAQLEQAAIVFWVGPALEQSLVKPIRALGEQTVSVALMESIAANLLNRREGGIQGQPTNSEQTSADRDPHVWLDPRVASMVVGIMADAMAKVDPAHAAAYAENAITAQQALNELETEISAYLMPVTGRPYVVFHDAYQYFENRFNLRPMAIVSVDSDHPPGAKRIAAIRELLIDNTEVCIFVEPQITLRLVETLREGTSAKTSVLDPVGMGKELGLAGYLDMLWKLAGKMRLCLE